ncbi:MAG TPA: orotidine-5'-phosphate decarboxylase [Acidobacteriaceae bacterium]
MTTHSFLDKYNRRVEAIGSLLCVGLDSEIERIPASFSGDNLPQFAFNRWIIDRTAEYAAAIKLNMAFYEARGARGWDELHLTMEYLRAQHPEIVTICDAKRADIGNTNRGYVTAIFDDIGFDAVTLHPYLGREALAPFLERTDKACIILCRTSNPGAGEFQDLDVEGRPLWQAVAEKVDRDWNSKGNCMLVVGATYPGEMRTIRAIAPDITLLVPGVGAQGGDVVAVVAAGLDAHGRGLVISSSRGIIFSSDPAGAARELRDEINAAREAVYAAR